MAAYGGGRDDLLPLHVVGEEFGGTGRARHGGRLDRDALRVVAAEVRGVDDDAADDAGGAEPDQGPVVLVRGGERVGGVRAAPAAGLPAVHDLALVAEVLGVEDGALADEEVLALGEELVVGGDHARAETAVGEVDQFREGEVGGAVVGVRVTAAVRGRVVGVGILVVVLILFEGHAFTVVRGKPLGPSKVFARIIKAY